MTFSTDNDSRYSLAGRVSFEIATSDSPHDRERRAQLVRGIGHKLLLLDKPKLRIRKTKEFSSEKRRL